MSTITMSQYRWLTALWWAVYLGVFIGVALLLTKLHCNVFVMGGIFFVIFMVSNVGRDTYLRPLKPNQDD